MRLGVKSLFFISPLLTALPINAHGGKLSLHDEMLMFFFIMSVLITILFSLAPIVAIILVGISKLEWHLFKKYNFYNSWEQIYGINITGLWSFLLYFFYFLFLIICAILCPILGKLVAERFEIFFMFIPYFILYFPMVIIPTIIKWRRIKLLPGNNQVKAQIILFSLIILTILSSSILLIVWFCRYQSNYFL